MKMLAGWSGSALALAWVAVWAPPAIAAAGQGGPDDVPTPVASPRGDYRIGPEDVLNVIVWQNADLTRLVPVRPDGMISLPLVNDVQAAGLTPMELRDVLKQKLAEYVPAAEISVIVAEVNSFSVSVIGKVKSPGRYKLKSPTSVLAVLALAGGFEEFADSDRVVILRPQAVASAPGKGKPVDGFKRMTFNYKRIISAGGESENLALQPGDIVVVP
jgi:polysaccharide export outer membrane protein